NKVESGNTIDNGEFVEITIHETSVLMATVTDNGLIITQLTKYKTTRFCCFMTRRTTRRDRLQTKYKGLGICELPLPEYAIHRSTPTVKLPNLASRDAIRRPYTKTKQ
ncbi:hypothetical protein J6590_072039, partial [Homalodisca vitripennis]